MIPAFGGVYRGTLAPTRSRRNSRQTAGRSAVECRATGRRRRCCWCTRAADVAAASDPACKVQLNEPENMHRNSENYTNPPI